MIREADSKELELFHYGVKGMKWGVRRPVGSDGLISKAASGLAKGKIKDNEDLIKLHENIRDRKGGKLTRAISAPDRILMGKTMFEKYHNNHINSLKSQNERIKKGETTVLDKIDIAMNTPIYQVYRANR